jgi:predicted regulator of Ras-like GTPase activity (Roadblock/LC7/MglB family)
MALMYRADLLERNLARLCNLLEGVRAAVIVSGEGLVVACHPPGRRASRPTVHRRLLWCPPW